MTAVRLQRRLTLWRVRRIGHDGVIRDTRTYAQRAAAEERARRWLRLDSTAEVTVEQSAEPVSFEPTSRYRNCAVCGDPMSDVIDGDAHILCASDGPPTPLADDEGCRCYQCLYVWRPLP